MIRMPRQARNERKEDLKKVIAGCWLVLVFPHRDHHLLHVAGQVAEMRECAPRRPGVIARVETRRTCRARNPRFILQSSSCSTRGLYYIGTASFSFIPWGNGVARSKCGFHTRLFFQSAVCGTFARVDVKRPPCASAKRLWCARPEPVLANASHRFDTLKAGV